MLCGFERDKIVIWCTHDNRRSMSHGSLTCCCSWAMTATDIPFVVIMSDDKDMLQIVDENIYILAPGR